MPRPCHCERTETCRLCWLYHRDPAYRCLWEPEACQPAAASQASAEPGLLTKAVTFAGAVVQHVAAGLPTLSAVQVEARLAICQICDSYDGQRILCRQCGCNLSMKAAWAEQRCPLGKWSVEA